MTPDVSVIIAAYNVEAYIERAVRSALDQEGVSVEVIVIDDASTDGTSAAVERCCNPCIKLIRLEKNGGPSIARNTGFAAAAAPWIAVLDGDDVFLPERLKRCLIRAKATDADIIVDNLDVFRESDGARYPMFNPTAFAQLGVVDLRTFISGNSSFLGGTAYGYLKPIFSASFLRSKKLAYDPDIRIGEDYMLMAEALANGARCAVEPSPGYLYTVRSASISHRLALSDVTRIANGDKKFMARYQLDAATAKAQKRREYALQEAFAYIRLLDALKSRDIGTALRILRSCPLAAFNLWQPLWVRIRRLWNDRLIDVICGKNWRPRRHTQRFFK